MKVCRFPPKLVEIEAQACRDRDRDQDAGPEGDLPEALDSGREERN